MVAQRVIEKQDRIVMTRGLVHALRAELKQGYCRVICTEKVITQYMEETPVNYEELLSYVVADAMIDLSQRLQVELGKARIYAHIKNRRTVIVTIRTF